jgi:hypothetical protein
VRKKKKKTGEAAQGLQNQEAASTPGAEEQRGGGIMATTVEETCFLPDPLPKAERKKSMGFFLSPDSTSHWLKAGGQSAKEPGKCSPRGQL